KPLAAAALDQRETVRLLHSDNYHAGQRAVPSAVPVYAFPEGAARALGHAARYQAWRGRPHGRVPEFSGLRTEDAKAQVTAFLRANPKGGWLPGQAARDLLACYQVPLVPARMAADEAEAVRAAAGFGGPVVLKAEAAGLVHKTEAGAVKLGLHGEAEGRAAYRGLAATFRARLTRWQGEPMVSGRVGVLAGGRGGPVAGRGGVSGRGGGPPDAPAPPAARPPPPPAAAADALPRGVPGAPRLFAPRGPPPVDTAALADVLLRVSRLASDL